MPDIKSAAVGSGITPQMSKEPPKEILEQTFTLDPSIKIGEGSSQTITGDSGKEIKPVVEEVKKEEPVVETKVDVPVKEEVKKEETVVKKEEPKPILRPPKKDDKKDDSVKVDTKTKLSVKPVTLPAKTDETFDYSGFSQQEVVNLKNMSRQSREFSANLIRENKQLAGLKDSNYLQHEQGYTLSPEYQNLQAKVYFANIEGQAWKQQLLNIRAGKPFRDVVGFNENGTPRFGDERPPTDEDDIRLSNNLAKCMSMAQQRQGELQSIPQQFKQRITADLQNIRDVQKQQFSWVADPKLLDYEMTTENGNKTVKQIKDEFKSIWPSYLQNSPAVDVASDLMVALMIRHQELEQANTSKTVAETLKEEVLRGEPGSTDRPVKTDEAVGGVTEFSLAGFSR